MLHLQRSPAALRNLRLLRGETEDTAEAEDADQAVEVVDVVEPPVPSSPEQAAVAPHFDAALDRLWRASLSADSLLALEEVVEALPGHTVDVARWVEDTIQPSGDVAGRAVYRWGDVVRSVAYPPVCRPQPSASEESPWLKVGEAAAEFRICERTLRAMLPDLKGTRAVIQLRGTWRIHRHWLVDTLAGFKKGHHHGMAIETEETESEDGQGTGVLLHRVEDGREGEDAGTGLHLADGCGAGQEDSGGPSGGRPARRARDFRAFLFGDEDDDASDPR